MKISAMAVCVSALIPVGSSTITPQTSQTLYRLEDGRLSWLRLQNVQFLREKKTNRKEQNLIIFACGIKSQFN